MLYPRLKQLLHTALSKVGIPVSEVAKALGISDTRCQQYFDGEKRPQEKTKADLAKILNITVKQITDSVTNPRIPVKPEANLSDKDITELIHRLTKAKVKLTVTRIVKMADFLEQRNLKATAVTPAQLRTLIELL